MAWDSVLVDRLRYFINDLSTPYVWTDNQLKKFILLSAIQIANSLQQWGIGSYTFDTANLTINPDPVTNTNINDAFCNLIVIKASIFIAGAELKKAAGSAGYIISDDKSTIDSRQVLTVLKGIQDTYNALYEQAEKDFKEGNKYSGSAILSPFASSDAYTPLYYNSNIYPYWNRV